MCAGGQTFGTALFSNLFSLFFGFFFFFFVFFFCVCRQILIGLLRIIQLLSAPRYN